MCCTLLAAEDESGRGQPHSKTSRTESRVRECASVVECGCPLPLYARNDTQLVERIQILPTISKLYSPYQTNPRKPAFGSNRPHSRPRPRSGSWSQCMWQAKGGFP